MSDRSDEYSVSLRQHEEPFLATFALVGFGVAHLTLDGKFTMVSHRLCEIIGHPRTELIGKPFQDILHAEDFAPDLVDRRLLAGEVPTSSAEKRVIRDDGRIIWIKVVLAPVRDEDTRASSYLLAVIEDITSQKEALQALYESETRFRMLVQMAPEAILVMDPADNRLVEANRRAEELFGCSREELLDSGWVHFYDADRPAMIPSRAIIDEHNRRALAGEEVVFERAIHNAKGEHRYCEVRLGPFPAGEQKYVLASFIDITERKRAEESLKRQVKFDELMTRILTRFTTCAAFEVDASVTDALRQLAQFIGVDHGHVMIFSADRSTWRATHEWCGPNIPAQAANFQDTPLGLYSWTESRLLAGQIAKINTLDEYPPGAAERDGPDKKAGATSNLRVPIHGTAGVITGAVGVDSHSGDVVWSDDDVARCKMVGDAIASALERKRAEQALRESEQRFRVMADSAPILMWMSGTDKRCTDFNRGWLEFTGRTLQQELGDGWTENVHPADLQKCFQTYVAAFDRQRPFTMEYRLRRHDGEYRWIRDTGVPRFLPDRSFAGYIGCCIDIDDHRVAEMARLELAGRLMTAQETERARIARELHDDIGQSLALLGIQLQRSSQPPSGAPNEKRVDARELRDRVKEIGDKVSRLSHQLHSSELEYLGLAVAVKSLCREFSEQYHIAVECSCDGIPAELDGNVALACLRVIQEALHNVAKHSRATSVQVEVDGNSDDLSLAISDNGAGFDASRPGAGPGLGLISMRERMNLISGDFMISSSPGNGTRIKARAPLLAVQ